jgi:hypothetical protein
MASFGGKGYYLTEDKTIIQQRNPRICMLTARNFVRYAFRCGIYEGEDVLLDVDDVDLVYLKPGKASALRKDIHKRIVWHDFTRKAISVNMAFKPTKLDKDYDLFIAYLPLTQDLTHIPAIKGWKDRCRTSICWIDEIYAADVPKLKPWLTALDQFDHLVVGLQGTVKAMSDAMKRQCHFVPLAVDVTRFTPYPEAPDRVIDIFNMGRRRESLHQAFLDIAARTKMFYVYDTFNTSYTEVNDHRQHREMLANMMKHSRYLVVAPAKIDKPEETKNQIEIGLRYYEASAAGAIMIGQAPDCESFDTMFNWPDAVIDVQLDGSDLEEIISNLAAQPERLLEISRRNASEALLRHDWAYRWETILKIAGLEPGPKLLERKLRLRSLSKMVQEI